MISTITVRAFSNELVKIADDRGTIDKGKLKRFAFTVVPAAAIGTGLGVGVGRLLRRESRPGGAVSNAAKKIPPSLVRKYGPAAVSGLASAALAARYLNNHYVSKAIRGKDDESRRS